MNVSLSIIILEKVISGNLIIIKISVSIFKYNLLYYYIIITIIIILILQQHLKSHYVLYRHSLNSFECSTPISGSTLMKDITTFSVRIELKRTKEALLSCTGREAMCLNLKMEPEAELEIN